MKNRSNHSHRMTPRSALRRGGFTLVEILVAVAIMSLLLSIIFVPLRLGFETYHIGKVNSDLQQEAHLAIQQIVTDLRKSQFVFPNSAIKGVSDNSNVATSCYSAPYPVGTAGNSNDWNYRPYVIADTDSPATEGSPVPPSGSMTYGVCSTVTSGTTKGVKAWSNPARLDMLQLRRDNNGATANSKVGQDFIVSYYFRRRDISKPYDSIDNPIALFRAQIPFRNRIGNDPGTPFSVPNNTSTDTDRNAQTDWTSYPSGIGSCSVPQNRSFAWITHNFYGEANLEPLTSDATPKDTSGNPLPNSVTVPGAHTLVTPSDMGLYAPLAGTGQAESYVPELSFTEEAVGGSRINRVSINLTLAKYDEAGAAAVNGQGKSLKVRVSQTIDLPNAGCSN